MGGHMHDSCDLQGIRNEHLFALKLWGGSTTIGSKFLVVAVAKFPEFHPSSLPEYQPFGTVWKYAIPFDPLVYHHFLIWWPQLGPSTVFRHTRIYSYSSSSYILYYILYIILLLLLLLLLFIDGHHFWCIFSPGFMAYFHHSSWQLRHETNCRPVRFMCRVAAIWPTRPWSCSSWLGGKWWFINGYRAPLSHPNSCTVMTMYIYTYMYMYICMYIYMYAYMYTYIYRYICVYIYL